MFSTAVVCERCDRAVPVPADGVLPASCPGCGHALPVSGAVPGFSPPAAGPAECVESILSDVTADDDDVLGIGERREVELPPGVSKADLGSGAKSRPGSSSGSLVVPMVVGFAAPLPGSGTRTPAPGGTSPARPAAAVPPAAPEPAAAPLIVPRSRPPANDGRKWVTVGLAVYAALATAAAVAGWTKALTADKGYHGPAGRVTPGR